MRTSTRPTAGRSASTSSSRQSFPSQLHHMLDDAELKGFDDIVSWQPHGRCFVVHKVTEFVDKVLPHYFRQSKFPSFQRQLNLYEFSRITRGKDRNGYYHDRFLRHMPELSEWMNRCKVKGTRVRHAPQPELEPDFYSYPPLSASRKNTKNSSNKGKKKSQRRAGGLPKLYCPANRTYDVKKKTYQGLKITKPLPHVSKMSALVTPPETPQARERPQILTLSMLLQADDLITDQPIGPISAPPASRGDLLAILEDAQKLSSLNSGEGQSVVLDQAFREPAREDVKSVPWPSLEWPRDGSTQDMESVSMVTTGTSLPSISDTSIERVNSIVFFEGKPFHYMESDAVIPLT